MMRRLLLVTTMFWCGISVAQAEQYKLENRTMKPRIDLTARTGTENRRIGTFGAWVPLSQNDNEVLYSDFRFTRQNSDDDEGNFGIGYRSMNIVPGAVVGVHGWYDNRHTNRGTIVHQATIGAEYMSDKMEARVNAYAPIASKTKRWITPNIGHTTPYLAGNGIYIDTNGIIIEEPQPGFDLEFGAPFTPAEKYVDSLRIYGGVYSFFGHDTPDVSGVRFRAVADINPWIQVGTRLQNDSPRGAQAYLEATFRLPVSAKLMKKRDGLRSHLDESPIRDIDIVTGSYVDTGGMKPVLNTDTGTAQRVIYVDNTAATGGDGSINRPYNTLQTAESVLQDHDILYIARGDGTTTGMDQGITIAKNGVEVIGSGVNFVYDAGRFTPSAGTATNGSVLRTATANPILTNIEPHISSYTGNVVTVIGDNATLTGFTTDGGTQYGVLIDTLGQTHESFSASYLTIRNSASKGLFTSLTDNSVIENVTYDHITALNNVDIGLDIAASNPGTRVGTAIIRDSSSTGNTNRGLFGIATNGGRIDTLLYENNTATGNSVVGHGIQISTLANSSMGSVTLRGNTTTGNTNNGIYVNATSGTIDSVTIQNNTANTNTISGIRVDSSGAGASIGTLSMTGNTTSSNTSSGHLIFAQTGGTITSASISNATINGNADRGVYVRLLADGHLGTLNLTNNTSSSNTGANGRGIQVEVNGVGATLTTATLSGNTTSNNASYGAFMTAAGGGAITTASVTNATASTNNNVGIYALAQSDGDIGTITFSNNTSNGNTGASGIGLRIDANGAGSTIGTVTMSSNTSRNNAQQGQYINALSSGAFTNVSISNATSTNNASSGVFVVAQTSGVIASASVSGATSTTNTIGLYVQALTLGSINALNLTGNTLTSNTSQGIRIDSNGNAGTVITSATLTGNVVTNNATQGIYIFGNSAGALNSATLTHNTSTGNTGNGVFIDDDTSGTFVVDMGGGVNSGTGQNRIFSNTGTEIRVDLDGGQLKAENNWWGVGTGLAGGETTLDAASTIDATPFLATDPGP